MDLQERIKKDLAAAMKSRDSRAADTFRFLLSSIHNFEIEKRKTSKDAALSEEETLIVLKKEAKKRKEAMEIFEKNGRNELAEKERDELILIEKYLPAKAGEVEIQSAVAEVRSEMGDDFSEKNFGRIIGQVMKKLNGNAEPSLVSSVVKKEIS